MGAKPEAAQPSGSSTSRSRASLGAWVRASVVPGPWTRTAPISGSRPEHIATMKRTTAATTAWPRRCSCCLKHGTAAPPPRSPATRRAIPAAARRLLSRIGGAMAEGCLGSPRRRRPRRRPSCRAPLVDGTGPPPMRGRCASARSCSVPFLAQTSLPAVATAAAFLVNAVRFANDRLAGTWARRMLVHPATARELGPAASTRRLPTCGTAPSASTCGTPPRFCSPSLLGVLTRVIPPTTSRADPGFVHNTFLLESVEKTVVRGPFYPFPRGSRTGASLFLPKPPWFVTHRSARKRRGRRLYASACSPGYRHAPGLFRSPALLD
jgi:hypothetical protein